MPIKIDRYCWRPTLSELHETAEGVKENDRQFSA